VQVSLIVFDECHHCRKNHAYNAIMREYYQISHALRPKIFGMTASPIWNPKDPEGSLGTLEKNLDAIAISVKDHIAELRDNSPRPVEVGDITNTSSRVLLLIVIVDHQTISRTSKRIHLSQGISP